MPTLAANSAGKSTRRCMKQLALAQLSHRHLASPALELFANVPGNCGEKFCHR
jgi:hypothetical protein